ncbi:uncharacterized protein LOC143913861 isoform X4 [Arctopsyche grandis]|uniref:uncharacterized protein LOC143913861 isoform X4 n=1 Tax=Arctopsyche grandis TaxID=121162 RepID=UPI00406D77B7
MFRNSKTKVNYSQSFDHKKSQNIASSTSKRIDQLRTEKNYASFRERKKSSEPTEKNVQNQVVWRNKFYSPEERSRRKSIRNSKLQNRSSYYSEEENFISPPVFERSKTFVGEERDVKSKTSTLMQRAASFRASMSKIFRTNKSPNFQRKLEDIETLNKKSSAGASTTSSLEYIPSMTEENLKIQLTKSPKPSKPRSSKRADERSGSFEFVAMGVVQSKDDQKRPKEEGRISFAGTSASSLCVENELYQSSTQSSKSSLVIESLKSNNPFDNMSYEKKNLVLTFDDALEEFNTISKKFANNKHLSDENINRLKTRKKINNSNLISPNHRYSKSLTLLPQSGVYYEESLKPSNLTPAYVNSLSRTITNKSPRDPKIEEMQSAIPDQLIFQWITDEQASVYSKDQKPPYVIPRIKPFKHKPPTSNHRHSKEVHHVDEEPKSPTMRDVRRMFEEGAFNKANSESPKFPRLQPRMGGSTETLAVRMAYSPQEPSPIELRQNADSGSRYSKAKSLVTPERKEQMNRSYTIVQKPLLPKLYDPKSSVMLEHLLYRTKLTDNGKKVKKNWQYNYAVLTQTALMFYKDQKAYQSAKLSSANIQPDAFVLLMGALVADGTPQQTKRRNPIVITSNKQQHILQHDEPLIIRDWFDHIRKAINKLPSDYVCPDNSKIGINTLGSPSPTHRRISGTKSSSKDEPVFGRSLDQVCPDTNPQVPEFVTHCIKAIEASEENMRADGLYRASGNLSQVQKIRLEVDQNNLLVLDKDIDVHVLTGALKLFFRELKEPLIPFKFFQKTLNASSNPVAESRTKEFREIVHGLPECNKQTLQYLLEHLLRVTYRKEHNRMHISNLAIVLGPTLLWAPSESSHNLAIDCLQQNQVIEILLSDFDKIFKEEGKRK